MLSPLDGAPEYDLYITRGTFFDRTLYVDTVNLTDAELAAEARDSAAVAAPETGQIAHLQIPTATDVVVHYVRREPTTAEGREIVDRFNRELADRAAAEAALPPQAAR